MALKIHSRQYLRAISLIFTLCVLASICTLYWGTAEIKSEPDPLQKLNKLLDDNEKWIKISEESITKQLYSQRWNGLSSSNYGTIGVLVLACNRKTVSRSLESIFKHKPTEGFPVIVSHACEDVETEAAIRQFDDKLLYLKKPREEIPISPDMASYGAYYKISSHYKWALQHMFGVLNYEQVIIIEDDIEVAPDFFNYFHGFLPLLRTDETLLCVSSWNDNGKRGKVEDPSMFYRSNFFPGLGWMMTRNLWIELEPKWPAAFWDDWLRGNDIRKGRDCIRPEISRSKNFGKVGVSVGQYFDEHIAAVEMVEETVTYSLTASNIPKAVNIDLYKKQHYDQIFLEQVYTFSTSISSQRLKELLTKESDKLQAIDEFKKNENIMRASYAHNKITDKNSKFYCGKSCCRRFVIFYEPDFHWENFVKEAVHWDLMVDIRAHLARTSYGGIVCWKEMLQFPQETMLRIENGWAKFDERFVSVCIAPVK